MTATITAITGTMPQRLQPQETFDANVAGLVAALPDFQSQANTLAAEANANAAAAAASAAAALASKTAADADAASAAASATTAVNAPGTSATSTTSLAIQTSLPAAVTLTIQTGKSWTGGQYVSITASASTSSWMEGRITAYNAGTGQLDVSVTRSQGTGTFTAWSIGLAAAAATTVTNSVQAKSAGFTAYKTDIGREYTCTGTWTAGFDAAASLGDGWYAWYKNSGTGVITFDPTASELIDGASTVALQPGDSALVACDGTAFTTIQCGQSGMKLIGTITPSGSSPNIDFLTSFSTTYDDYLLVANGLLPASGAAGVWFTFAVAGVVDSSASYGGVSGTGAGVTIASNQGNLCGTMGASTTKGANIVAEILNVNSASLLKSVISRAASQQNTTPNYQADAYTTFYPAANAVSGIRLSTTSGANFAASGKVRLYGRRNS